MTREIPLYTLEGVRDADIDTHPFNTDDGLGLSLLRFQREPTEDAVLIIHGLTTSSDMFIMPEHTNLVQYLLDAGWGDVWTLDYRMSNRHPYNLTMHRYNMDDIALYDMPAALARVREEIGDRPLHVICHCLGSVSFMMALFGRSVGGISSVIANSVALTPQVPRWSRFKLAVFPFLSERVMGFTYLNPRWPDDPGFTWGKAFSKVVTLFHRECDVPSCHMLSTMWGTGWPAVYRHENLHPVTHRRGGDLYGGTSVHYYRHVRRMVRAGNTAVKMLPGDERYAALPDNYFEHAAEIRSPVLFITGEDNRVFTDSNIECHRRLEEVAPGRHQLHVFSGYGHQDVFMGKNNHVDVFPRLLEFLEAHRGRVAEDDPAPVATETESSPGIRFREQMSGWFSMGADNPAQGAERGRRAGSRLVMEATVRIPDLARFEADPDNSGELIGTIRFDALGDVRPAGAGRFNLFADTGAGKRMIYELPLRAGGEDYYFAGDKEIADEGGFDIWKETTTLYVRLHRGTSRDGEVVGAGILTLGLRDLSKLLRTVEVTGASGKSERVHSLARFGRFFFGELWDSYVRPLMRRN